MVIKLYRKMIENIIGYFSLRRCADNISSFMSKTYHYIVIRVKFK